MDLAWQFGCTIAELNERLGETGGLEMAWWIAYFRVDPPSRLRADVRAATIAAMVFNRHRTRGESQRGIRQFLAFQPPTVALTPDEMLRKFRYYRARHGG